jgi:hypothetical protein
MRAFGRWLGYLLLTLAVAIAAWDGVEAFRSTSRIYRASSLGEIWSRLNRSSLDAAETASPWLTDHVIAPVLAWPAWLVLGVLGVALALACWRRNNNHRRRRHRSRF